MSAVVTKPGIYDIPEDVYHADPVPEGSLSVTGAKKLLAEGGPARWRYQLDHPPQPSDAMELGIAAHKLVLGTGKEIAIVNAKDWTTKAAREGRDAARAEGKLPLLPHQHEQVKAMAAAIRAHPLASALFDPGRGMVAERSAFWPDERFGVWRRARFDVMREPGRSLRPAIGDYKTTADASPEGFAKAIGNFRYHMQDQWYRDAYQAVYGVRPVFLFVAQEKEPPYLIGVYAIDAEAEMIAREANERALEIYRDCREADAWPGYSLEVETLALPRWARAREDVYA